MAVKATKSYICSDGKVHFDYQNARAHEARWHAQQRQRKSQEARLNRLKDILCNPNLVCTNGGVNLCLDLLNKPQVAAQLRDVLNSVLEMHRNFEKDKS